MKKIFTLLSVLLLLTSCDSKLDIVPKGKTTLSTVSDLETLLEQRFMLSSTANYETLVGNTFPVLWEQPGKTLADKSSEEYAYLAGDASVDRAELATTDYTYESAYQYINYMNVIVSKAPEASGDASDARRIVAEAKIMRAWLHFLIVNMYAAQYDEATAATTGGIAYVADTNPQTEKTKLTVAEVYDHILADCSDEVIADLRQTAVNNPFRFGAEFGNAVRASVLFQMKRYADALPYAQKAIALNSKLEDRTTVLTNLVWTLPHTSDNNYLLIYHNNSNIGEWGGVIGTPEFCADIDPDDVLVMLGQNTQDGWGDNSGYGPDGALMCGSWDVHYNSYGIRTENMYYLIAEAMIRAGQYREGLRYVDAVRDLRIYDNASKHYYDRTDITTEAQAMDILQKNKRVEMFTTIYNFFDRRRWNTEPAYRKASTHDCGEDGYFTVEPDSPLWITPFPKSVTLYNSSMTQNY